MRKGRGRPASDGQTAREGTQYCFITTDSAGDIFFHLSDARRDHATVLEEGDTVDFKIMYDARKGKDKAVDVRLIEKAAAVATTGEEYDASGSMC